jgi:hypothetical protein
MRGGCEFHISPLCSASLGRRRRFGLRQIPHGNQLIQQKAEKVKERKENKKRVRLNVQSLMRAKSPKNGLSLFCFSPLVCCKASAPLQPTELGLLACAYKEI